MLLFHFTSQIHLPYILSEGVKIGDVPITALTGFNAPWFTRDPNPQNQQWCQRPPHWRCGIVDKTAVRLTVEFDPSDVKLVPWNDVAAEYNVSKSFYDCLNETGGGGAHNWFIYKGIADASRITKVDVLRDVRYPGNLRKWYHEMHITGRNYACAKGLEVTVVTPRLFKYKGASTGFHT